MVDTFDSNHCRSHMDDMADILTKTQSGPAVRDIRKCDLDGSKVVPTCV
jgi:hypothetical protein